MGPDSGIVSLGNVDYNAKGFREIDTKWAHVGILSTTDDADDEITDVRQRMWARLSRDDV